MTQAVSQLLLNPRLRLTTADALPPSVFERFPIKAGCIHEWFLEGDYAGGRIWFPPLTLLADLAFRGRGEQPVFWIGRTCWPTFQVLHALQAGAIARSVFLDPCNNAERFWAIGQALRCPGVRAVIADGSGMDQTASRRLQLAAEQGMALGLIARPPWEISEPSCATTRWRVRPGDTAAHNPAWSIELLRCRGRRAGQDAPQMWQAEWSYQVHRGTGTLYLSAVVGRGTAAAAQARSGGEQALPRTA